MPIRVLVSCCLVSWLSVGLASAQPQIALSTTVVVPGQSVTVTVTGGPGQFYALIGSSVNRGFSYGGVALTAGADVMILAAGTLDGSGHATVSVVPPLRARSSIATTCRA